MSIKNSIEEEIEKGTEKNNDIQEKNVIDIKDENIEKNNNKKPFSIFGISISRIFAYFIVYSVLGFILETLFAFVIAGVIESRQSFLYGPFCAIYGVGAVMMIVGLQKLKKNNWKLFLGGIFFGAIVEYLISLIREMVFHVKWWDYSNLPFNINGRICLTYSIVWGFLSVFLLKYFNPKIDNIINKLLVTFSKKDFKIAVSIIMVFMFIDWIISSFALQMFFTRIIDNQNIPIKSDEKYVQTCRNLYENEFIHNFIDTFWNDKVMLKTFPNLRVTTEHGAVIYVSNLYPETKTYYIKLFEPKLFGKIESELIHKNKILADKIKI